VMTARGDEMGAGMAGMAGRGRMLASHADREHVIGTLKTAFVEGRLTGDEFDARVDEVYTSRTYAELAEVTTDIPTGPARTEPPRDPWRATKLAWRGVYAIILPAIVTLIVLPGGRGNPSMETVITTAVVSYLLFWMIGVVVMVGSRHQKRSAGQLPRSWGDTGDDTAGR
jgi:hypothetical protein